MKSLIHCTLLLSIVGLGMSQFRPSYAPRPVQYPSLLPRFQENNDTLNNRVGEGNASNAGNANNAGSAQPLQPYDPYDYASRLPQDKQPFWYLNRQHIQQHLGVQQQGQQQQQQNQQNQRTQSQPINQRGWQQNWQGQGLPQNTQPTQFGQPNRQF